MKSHERKRSRRRAANVQRNRQNSGKSLAAAAADFDIHSVIRIIQQPPHVPHALQRLGLAIVLAVDGAAHDAHVTGSGGSDRRTPGHPRVPAQA